MQNFRRMACAHAMRTMNISLPDALKSFVDEQVSQRDYGTSSEHVCELIRKDQDRLQLRNWLLAGVASSPTAPVNALSDGGLSAASLLSHRTHGAQTPVPSRTVSAVTD